MDTRILSRLAVLSEEEKMFLFGMETIDRSIYMEGTEDVIAAHKLLEPGKLIDVRPHTRFVHFPEHTHDYVEMIYVCQGTARHLINGSEICLQQGELLVLGQNTRQEIFPASEGDISVNFIVRPELFGGLLDYLGSEGTPIREFFIRCLCGSNPSGYLLFRVSEVQPVQNLIENLLWTLFSDLPNRRSINRLTMGLLLMQLLNHTDKLTTGVPEQEIIVHVLRYIEENYCTGSLTDVAKQLHYDAAWLSREIKRRTGKNYTQLVQDKRLSQAGWLLKNTTYNVSDIAVSVGYENLSYFHRIFALHFGVSPKQYRDNK